MTRDLSTTAAAVVRGGWGCALLLMPDRILRLGSSGAPVPAVALATARVLGARQVLQSVTTLLAPVPAVVGAGAAVDALHGATAVGLGLLSPTWRRIAVVETLLATGFTATGWATAGQIVRAHRTRRRIP